MTEYNTSINNAKINIKWAEEYVSRGINRALNIIPPGRYDGGSVDYSDSTTLRISAGKYVLHDDADNYGSVIIDSDAATIDCSSMFPATVTKDWYVGISVDYTTGVETTGKFFVTDIAPSDEALVGRDGLILCTVTVHNTDTGLDQADFSQSQSAPPIPYPLRSEYGLVESSDRDIGLLDSVMGYRIPSANEKDGLVGIPSPPSASNKLVTEATKIPVATISPVTITSPILFHSGFQLSGDVYVGNGSTPQSAIPFFKILESEDDHSVAVNSEGAAITVLYLYTNDNAGQLIPSTHADSDGFYSNPYVYLEVSSGTVPLTSAACLFSKRVDIGSLGTNLSSSAVSISDNGHAETSLVKSEGGGQDRWTLSSGTAQSAISALLAAINETRLDPTILSGSNYALIYRSGGATIDSEVTANTISVYVGNGVHFVIKGGYWKSSDGHLYSTSAGSSDVGVIGLRGDGFFMAKAENVSSDTDLGLATNDFYTLAPWNSSISSYGESMWLRASSFMGLAASNFSCTGYADFDGAVNTAMKTVSIQGTSISVDMSQGNNFEIDMGSNVTSVSFSNDTAGRMCRLYITASGSYTLNGFPGGVEWPSGVSMPISFSSDTKILEFTKMGGSRMLARVIEEY